MRRALSCPSCGNHSSSVVKRKYLVTTLRRCLTCHLLYRAPTTSPVENERFYQYEYQQGFTTEMPSPEKLAQLMKDGFKNSEKDFSIYIAVLKSLGLGRGATLFDFGCSWGYGSWQLKQLFDVCSFEISRIRADYGKEYLGIDIAWDIDSVKGSFDVFFSAHVLEHVPNVKQIIELGMRSLRKGSFFVAFTPNGSKDYQKKAPWQWNKAWGLVHPNLLDDKFYRHRFRELSYLIASIPYDLKTIADWSCSVRYGCEQRVLDLEGNELLCIVKSPF